MTEQAYTTKLQAGLGLIPETEKLLDLWHPGMESRALLDSALSSGELTRSPMRNCARLSETCTLGPAMRT